MADSTPLAAATTHARIRALGRETDIEYYLIAPEKRDADLIIFLHEGLGSASMWKDWPAQLCEAAGCRGLVFSRYAYGASTPRPPDEKWPVEYMHDQAREALPALLEALDLQDERPILFGHSDGASIALLYAAMYPDAVKAIAVAAPHIFVEDISVKSIEAAREAYLHTDLPQRLGRYHSDTDSVFWGWNDIWLNPEFRKWNIEAYLDQIRCPILALQGVDDEYGTLDQIQGIKRIATHAKLCIIERCRHSPHKDQPETVIREVVDFLHGLT
ncbi:alpha/beta fold hydrolase [Pusillimonas noertemannii]|uniref:Pimeloyl-ACP methyl ester carboxylesterase n=1 Tax=Pusillimonas noertemannii TaxID=305977 RepID=A0A2U1CRA5_9BURK|nr:alpha/beta hydrolase [Pusillimonas noertemannii]NYT67759.1 alpha/beta hydrolase [Pusillimonas noertemannii]PVY68430.1 pimeloyl-ACP methyl ester carboxylesterase [Pusillimonas noertemannii]TFL12089.1 alpha/beta hydrolase [Pusillimonas noertemannii]